jgi:hypothetical protein
MPGAGPAAAVAVAASVAQPPFPGGLKRFGQFGDKPVHVFAGDASEHRMGQGRTGKLDRHKSETVRPVTA